MDSSDGIPAVDGSARHPCRAKGRSPYIQRLEAVATITNERVMKMKKAFVLTALLAGATADADNVVSSANPGITLDTRTQGSGVLAQETSVDSRGLTSDVSLEILLNTKIPLGTMIIIK